MYTLHRSARTDRITPREFVESLAATTVQPGLSPWKAVVVELLITASLVLTIFGATNEKRRSVFLPSLPIGMAVMLGVLIGVSTAEGDAAGRDVSHQRRGTSSWGTGGVEPKGEDVSFPDDALGKGCLLPAVHPRGGG